MLERPQLGITYSNYTDGVEEDASQCDNPLYTEHWDGSYVNPTATIFYGDWGSHTGQTVPEKFKDLDILVINDKDSDVEEQELFDVAMNIGSVFNYMAVADYHAAPASCPGPI